MVQWKRSRSLTHGLISITADLMSLQVPTICVVTGEASAAGFMLALSHDYVAMHADNGFLCMSDLNNLVTNRYFLSMMKAKVKDEEMFKDLVFRSLKIPAIEAMDKGVIDFVEKTATETVEAALKLGQLLAKKNWNGKVHASLRKRAFPEIGRAIGLPDEGNEV
ncbi:enoyl-CoA delta isomerase 1, peroxisomal-like [Asparagus officinalis]|nr:enoyl-CoA delta isomerase 1, peroxisomal-like [Asparagus officinalis]XP_020249034.1 enoyl-CoA delta isomerase 1, peroxisomal-like [Asparagus officinalis]